MTSSHPIRLLLAGATGAVGRQVLAAALADSRIGTVIAPTRHPLPAAAKLQNPLPDFTSLPADADWWTVDAVICALGTTSKLAGSQAAFAFVDRDLPIQIARLARAHGACCYVLNSSLGADLHGNFYLRTKAEAEAGIRAIGYPSGTAVRPSLIDAKRQPPRRAEALALAAARAFRPLIPRRYRPVAADRVARALQEAALARQAGWHVIESDQLQD